MNMQPCDYMFYVMIALLQKKSKDGIGMDMDIKSTPRYVWCRWLVVVFITHGAELALWFDIGLEIIHKH